VAARTADLPERLGGVLAVLFLVFNEGYLASSDGDPVRAEFTGEAIRLTRVLRPLLPEEPEVAGLLGLLLLTEARYAARVRDGQLVPLGEQDRAGWDRALIAEGHELVRECLAINQPGRYQLLAAINAVHTDAPTASDTDWSQVVALYDQLTRLDPSPLLRKLGRSADATEAYDAAIAATQNCAERAYLDRPAPSASCPNGRTLQTNSPRFLCRAADAPGSRRRCDNCPPHPG
jgi:RNA polymerase sigma-70 factor (ECF subfamily)